VSDLVKCKVVIEMLLIDVTHLPPHSSDCGTNLTDRHAGVGRFHFLPNLWHIQIHIHQSQKFNGQQNMLNIN